MPLYDAEKLRRNELREKLAVLDSNFRWLSAAAVLIAGLCGYAAPVEHYCISLAVLTLGLIVLLRAAGGQRMQGPIIIATVALLWIYTEFTTDVFASLPFTATVKYWLFGAAFLGAAVTWGVFTADFDPRDADAAERARSARYAAVTAGTLLWVLAAHYIPRHY